MPDNPIVWIVAIVATAIVVVFALWKGQVVEVELKPPRLRFKRRGGGEDTGISVASGMTIENSTTGDIAGVKTSAPHGPAETGDRVSVAQGARLSGARTGDIVGIKQSDGTGADGDGPA